MKVRFVIAAGAAAVALGACAPQPGVDPGLQGAAVGAVGGAAVGQAVGRDRQATIIGGTLGAVAGGLTASELERRRLEQEQQARTIQTVP